MSNLHLSVLFFSNNLNVLDCTLTFLLLFVFENNKINENVELFYTILFDIFKKYAPKSRKYKSAKIPGNLRNFLHRLLNNTIYSPNFTSYNSSNDVSCSLCSTKHSMLKTLTLIIVYTC